MVSRQVVHILLFLLLCGCSQIEHPSSQKSLAFYYWKTAYSLSAAEVQSLKSLGAESMYLRFFDVTWDADSQSPSTNNKMVFQAQSSLPRQLVPVVFIAQEVLQKLAPADTDELAAAILQKLLSQLEQMPPVEIPEVQIDCDWTPGTKEKYFLLLTRMQLHAPPRLEKIRWSATLRLHQIRDREKNGVPPVDRATLMIYHTSSPAQLSEKNSILDVPTAMGYLHRLDQYPLELDIALPIFSWAVQYDSFQRFVRLFNDVDANDLDPAVYRAIGTDRFEAQGDVYLKGKRIMRGDIVKVDQARLTDCMEILKQMKDRRTFARSSLVLFHYDSSMIRRFTHEDSSRISALFHRF